ncbi:lanthionine synthetase LanC family protein [Paraflavitalea speifideaquila]|uniref:lanthionine synthetase LanC family protein n=1 Tax=Paraflavitalea speifideaquila TaxID=3076558 RepID=UPI0028F02711|nr:lanthionine synthetase LanC family protein [Paraflavitalea speifideiaquila]
MLSCLTPEDIARPSAAEVREVLVQYKNDLRNKATRPDNQSGLFSKEEILNTLQHTINTLSTPLLADEGKGWFADDMTPPVGDDKHKLRKQWYASYNRGVTGVMYLLAQAKKAGLDVDVTCPYVDKALELVKLKYINRLAKASGGLHYAADGIAAVLALSVRHGLIEASEEHLDWIDKLLDKNSDFHNMIGGVAGQGMANMVCMAFISPATLRDRLERYAKFLSDKQEANGSWTNGFVKKKYRRRKVKKVNPGFAFGMAGTIYFLLSWKNVTLTLE